MAKQIGKLERELTRNEKALAEAATRLLLREPESPIHGEEDNLAKSEDEESLNKLGDAESRAMS
jgi:hypothetical protein